MAGYYHYYMQGIQQEAGQPAAGTLPHQTKPESPQFVYYSIESIRSNQELQQEDPRYPVEQYQNQLYQNQPYQTPQSPNQAHTDQQPMYLEQQYPNPQPMNFQATSPQIAGSWVTRSHEQIQQSPNQVQLEQQHMYLEQQYPNSQATDFDATSSQFAGRRATRSQHQPTHEQEPQQAEPSRAGRRSRQHGRARPRGTLFRHRQPAGPVSATVQGEIYLNIIPQGTVAATVASRYRV